MWEIPKSIRWIYNKSDRSWYGRMCFLDLILTEKGSDWEFRVQSEDIVLGGSVGSSRRDVAIAAAMWASGYLTAFNRLLLRKDFTEQKRVS